MIEIIDAAENIDRLLPFLDTTVKEGLFTVEKVDVITYRPDNTGRS